MKRVSVWLKAGVLALMMASSAAMATAYSEQKVVYHINDEGQQDHVQAMRFIQNHINAVGEEKIDLKVVMHGDGLAMIMYPESIGEVKVFKTGSADDNVQARIDGLKDQGVQFLVCENTVTGREVDPFDHLHNVDEEDIVPSGVATLSELQLQGYTYIRP